MPEFRVENLVRADFLSTNQRVKNLQLGIALPVFNIEYCPRINMGLVCKLSLRQAQLFPARLALSAKDCILLSIAISFEYILHYICFRYNSLHFTGILYFTLRFFFCRHEL